MARAIYVEAPGLPLGDEEFFAKIVTEHTWVTDIIQTEAGLYLFESTEDAKVFKFFMNGGEDGATLH